MPHASSNGPRSRERGDEPAPDADPSVREELALVDEIRREEGDEQHLGDLARFEAERSDRRPTAGSPLTVRPMPGASGSNSAPTPERTRRCSGSARTRARRARSTSVSTNTAMPIATHSDWMRAWSAIEPGDRDESDAVQQRGERQQRRVGERGEAADREVRDEVETEHPREQRVEVGRELGPVRRARRARSRRPS